MRVVPGQLSLDLESALTPRPAPEPAAQPAPRGRVARPVTLPAVAGTEQLLTVAEVAQLTGLSLNAVYRAIWSGELQGSKLRGRDPRPRPGGRRVGR
jgi:excisionase family DNA binding protein